MSSPCSTRSPSPSRGSPTASTRVQERATQAIAGRPRASPVLDGRAPFLEEYCTVRIEVLYGATARTSKMRIGYGVRLIPKPYNRGAHGRVGGGARPALRRPGDSEPSLTTRLSSSFGVDPPTLARCGARGSSTVNCWTNSARRSRASALVAAGRTACSPSPCNSRTADLGKRDHGRRASPGGGARTRFVLVRGGRVTGRGEEEDRHLPRRGGAVLAADRQVREQRGGDVHDGALRAHGGGGA